MNLPTPSVFIVDDDLSMQRALSLLLKSAGFASRSFTSGDEFLANVGGDTEGCLILDIRMPGLSGLDVFERLMNEGSPLSVIFVTAYDESGRRDEALKAGAVAFLQKPFDDRDLLEALDVGFERSNSSRS